MSIFEDIKQSIEISDVQAINYFHRILKHESFRLVKRYNAYQFMRNLVQVIVLNKIPYTAEWYDDSLYRLNPPQLYEINNNNQIVLHNDVITYDDCTEVTYNKSRLTINIFRKNYSCFTQEYKRYLSCAFTIKVEDMNYAIKSHLVDEFFINELKKIAQQYYTQIAYDKMIEMCVNFVKKDIKKLA